MEWLKTHAEGTIIDDPNIKFLVSHHSPCGKEISWGYVLDRYDAKNSIACLKQDKIPLAFFGHSHIPTLANSVKSGNQINFVMGECVSPFIIRKDSYQIVNVGAIGQPRGKGVTTYGIFDSDKLVVNVKAFEYNIKGAQKSIMNAKYATAGANRRLAKRLEE